MSTKGGLLIAILLVVFDYRLTAGMILGLAFFRIYYYFLSENMTDQLETDSESRLRGYGSTAIRLLILAFPMLVSMVIPEVFSVWGAFFGLMAFKITLYGYTAIKGR